MSRAKTATVDPILISLDDVAAMLAVTRRTVEKLRAEGRFPAPDLSIGKLPRWRRETIERWIDEQSPNSR